MKVITGYKLDKNNRFLKKSSVCVINGKALLPKNVVTVPIPEEDTKYKFDFEKNQWVEDGTRIEEYQAVEATQEVAEKEGQTYSYQSDVLVTLTNEPQKITYTTQDVLELLILKSNLSSSGFKALVNAVTSYILSSGQIVYFRNQREIGSFINEICSDHEIQSQEKRRECFHVSLYTIKNI